MTEETSEVRARGQESQQPQEEVTLRSLMDFMRTQSESLKVINEKFDQQKEEINEKFDQQKEEINEKFEKQKEEINGTIAVINEKFDKQNEKFDKINEKLDSHRKEVKRKMAEQIAEIQAEMRDHKTICDDKVSEVLKLSLIHI